MSSAEVGLAFPLEQARWTLSLCASAGEAGGTFIPTYRSGNRGVRGAAANPERAREESARRARTSVRQYCAANRLNRLGTLTYRGEGCHDPREVRADLGVFWRSLRSELGGKAFPYLWVPEWHPSGHGLHAHFAVGKYVKHSLIERAWGHGFVHVTRLTDLRVGSTPLHEGRRAARYLSKYLSKTFESDLLGLHRFDVAQGFKPHIERLQGVTAAEALAQAVEIMRAEPAQRWSSDEKDVWLASPAVWFAWD